MADKADTSASIPFSGIIAVVMAVVAVIAHQTTLETSRPEQTERSSGHYYGVQDIDARLWQDPMAAVAAFRDNELKSRKQEPRSEISIDQTHDIKANLIREQIWNIYPGQYGEDNNCAPIKIMAVMTPGSPFEEDSETRRRTRYAVASALIKTGSVPDSNDTIGYAYVSKQVDPNSDLPKIIPYEWYSTSDENKVWTLVLWLDEGAFTDTGGLVGLQLLQKLLNDDPRSKVKAANCTAKAAPVKKSPLPFTVIGPRESDAYIPLLRSLRKSNEKSSKLNIISPSATGALPSRPSNCGIKNSESGSDAKNQYYEQSGKLTLLRIVGPDSRLTASLVEEIRNRQLDQGNGAPGTTPAMIIVHESDTRYGREISRMMKDAIAKDAPVIQTYDYSYLRGIDGRVGTKPANASDPDKGKTPRERETVQHTRSYGTHQIDYLERMVSTIRENHGKNSRVPNGKAEDVVAIAVFGNDVYDKLLIIRALKSEFPKAVFVTTDLDARFLDPSETSWSRNLIVASNYDLRLHPDLQAGTLPFRDSYQTATYLATWIATNDCLENVPQFSSPAWLTKPLLFEIGRTEAVPYNNLEATFLECKGKHFQIQPKLADRRPPEFPSFIALCFVLLTIAAFVATLMRWSPLQISPGNKAFAPGAAETSKTLAQALGCAVPAGLLMAAAVFYSDLHLGIAAIISLSALITIVVICALWQQITSIANKCADAAWRSALILGLVLWVPLLCGFKFWIQTPDAPQEPFTWVEGVSVWPTQLLRLIACVLAISFLWFMSHRRANDAQILADEFFKAPAGSSSAQMAVSNGLSAEQFWNDYRHSGHKRVVQMTVLWSLYFFSTFVIFWIFGISNGFPVRGASNLTAVQLLLMITVNLANLLLVAVAASGVTFVQEIIKPFSDPQMKFPPPKVTLFKNDHKLLSATPDDFIQRVLAVRLIAKRSKMITELIYWPFWVYALLIVARNPIFDNWDTPITLGFILGVPFVIILGCVIFLRLKTYAFHEKIIKELEEALLTARNDPAILDRGYEQLQTLFETVKSERRGSFQSIAMQPLIRALLIPLGGAGGIELLEHLILAPQ